MASVSFGKAAAIEHDKLAALARSARLLAQARNRLEVAIARHENRTRLMNRRERTRQLIELGAIVRRAGLVEAAGGNQEVLFGAMLVLAERLTGPDGPKLRLEYLRRANEAGG